MTGRCISPDQLRSRRWFNDDRDLHAFIRRSRAQQLGFSREDLIGKPVIAIINTWSDINPCHSHFRERAEDIKRGVLQAGGFPLEMPALSLAEPFQQPTTMLYRNLLALETEELLRSYPADGAVLMGGCDKTTPGLVMGATSANLPAIFMPGGPMLRGNWRGNALGSGTDNWKYWDELRAGTITESEWREIESGMARSAGHCMTMGTASTMTSATEALGLTLPGAASIPAPDSAHRRMATACGRRIVDMVWEDLKPSDILSRAAFENAVTVVQALSGSTNAVVHLLAMARRASIDLALQGFDEIGRSTPVLADIRPSGQYLMEDFYYAGGLRALCRELGALLDLSCPTVNGKTLGENIADATTYDSRVIRSLDNPLQASDGLVVLRGNLAPRGAVMKPAAADARLLSHRGPAVVFRDRDDMLARIDDESLAVDRDSVLVLQNAGPCGGPGMPEWGQLPIPQKLLKQGVRDMVRISDARMSGTAYGACVLHVAPESFVGGPLAFVRDGDMIELNVELRRLELCVGDDELAARRSDWRAPAARFDRGYGQMFQEHVMQADEGCDFDFMRPTSGAA